MGRTVRGRREPHLPRVEKIELSDSNVKGRLTAAVLLLVVGVALIVYSFMKFLSSEVGWQEIEADAAGEFHCGGDFTFLYELGKGEIAVNSEKKELTALYSDAAKVAYEIFNADIEIAGTANLWYINHHPNEEISVDAALYNALSQVCENGGRWIYLGPAYSVYDNLFYMMSSDGAMDFDPHLNPYVGNLFQEICEWGSDPEAINLELLESDVVRLNVSREYLDFMAEEELEDFIDFYWLKNAFIADYIADRVLKAGYTHGVISSYDGFVRCFDESGTTFSYQLYHMQEGTAVLSASMEYTGPQSFVTFKSYPLNPRDFQHYLILSEGSVRTPYLSLEDGLDRCALEELTAYSSNMGCVEIALKTAPIYIADRLQESRLTSLTEIGIYAVYWDDGEVCNSGPLPFGADDT